ncbi:MBL fold metallo-hydrolase [Yinghuangia seranimata]|uniref:MBL fold metallo-hydrolase n=1 Tax=Yinghuangia seranimata TaxID=408067 RepID=UPI00248ABCCE|nr:MBL fold metallo-hydrolase [Yinghuangia seranimata]MDI2125841.1 MBL fold metallo-hydrolase [Yinghuangia seranimata]
MAGRQTARRLAVGGAALAVAGWAALRNVPAELGGTAEGERLERMLRSPRYRDGAFHNPVPASLVQPQNSPGLFWQLMREQEHRRPAGPVPLVATPDTPAAGRDGLSVVWYGHASALVEIEGRRVLLDPVWSKRVSPSQLVGPARLHPVPVALETLPSVDAVLISHDHYDHLDRATVLALTAAHTAPFLVPLGIGAHLQRWGVPDERIIELDWEERAEVAGLTFTSTAARHFSGRTLRRNDTLWGSWVIAGDAHKVFYAGDSGYFDGYARIGAEHGPFDLTLMPIGAYSENWPDIHMNPEEAVNAHLDLGGELLLPVHWATFNLAFHAWTEPVNRLWGEAKARDVRIAVPRPGDRVDVADAPQLSAWWELTGQAPIHA